MDNKLIELNYEVLGGIVRDVINDALGVVANVHHTAAAQGIHSFLINHPAANTFMQCLVIEVLANYKFGQIIKLEVNGEETKH